MGDESPAVDVDLPDGENVPSADVELPTGDDTPAVDIELPIIEDTADINISLPDEIGISESPDIDLDLPDNPTEESITLPSESQQPHDAPLIAPQQSDDAVLVELRTQTDLLQKIADKEELG